jgi:hypothetical protein
VLRVSSCAILYRFRVIIGLRTAAIVAVIKQTFSVCSYSLVMVLTDSGLTHHIYCRLNVCFAVIVRVIFQLATT